MPFVSSLCFSFSYLVKYRLNQMQNFLNSPSESRSTSFCNACRAVGMTNRPTLLFGCIACKPSCDRRRQAKRGTHRLATCSRQRGPDVPLRSVGQGYRCSFGANIEEQYSRHADFRPCSFPVCMPEVSRPCLRPLS